MKMLLVPMLASSSCARTSIVAFSYFSDHSGTGNGEERIRLVMNAVGVGTTIVYAACYPLASAQQCLVLGQFSEHFRRHHRADPVLGDVTDREPLAVRNGIAAREGAVI